MRSSQDSCVSTRSFWQRLLGWCLVILGGAVRFSCDSCERELHKSFAYSRNCDDLNKCRVRNMPSNRRAKRLQTTKLLI
jgi:hypothetical protein